MSLVFQGCFIQHAFVAITHARVLFRIGIMVTSRRVLVRDSLVVSASCTRSCFARLAMGFVGGTKPWPSDPLVDVIGLPRAAAVG